MSAFLFWAVSFSQAAAEPDCRVDQVDDYAVVEKIYDGDTLRLSDKRKIRFIGINTPELEHDMQPAEPLADKARRHLHQLIPPGSRVGLRYDQQRKDRYRRTLAHLFRKDGLNITAEMIRQGFGFAIVVPPNEELVDCYFDIERKARKARLGVWPHPYFAAKVPGQLGRYKTGFIRVSGKVTHIGKGKKSIWLDMGRHFSLRLRRKNMHYFDDVPIMALTGKQITVRGWVNYYNGKLRMSLRHPAMLELQD